MIAYNNGNHNDDDDGGGSERRNSSGPLNYEHHTYGNASIIMEYNNNRHTKWSSLSTRANGVCTPLAQHEHGLSSAHVSRFAAQATLNATSNEHDDNNISHHDATTRTPSSQARVSRLAHERSSETSSQTGLVGGGEHYSFIVERGEQCNEGNKTLGGEPTSSSVAAHSSSASSVESSGGRASTLDMDHFAGAHLAAICSLPAGDSWV